MKICKKEPTGRRLAIRRSGSAENRRGVTACNTFGWTHVALYRLTTDDNALRKGWHMPPKMAAERI